MTPSRPFVVGIDFNQSSRIALEQALRLGSTLGNAVQAVHVIDSLVVTDLQEAVPSLAPGLGERLIDDAKHAWTGFVAGIAGAPALDVVVAHRVAGILRCAQEHQATLLVLGASGDDHPPDVGAGAVATACVRRSPVDVLLVRDTQRGPFRRIVAAVDFSPPSLRALQIARRWAALDGAQLCVLHVFDAPWHKLHYRAPTPEAAPHFQKQYRDALQRRLAAVAEAAGQASGERVRCELFDHAGHRSGIVEFAVGQEADLVVLGTRGRANLHDFLLGSTAEKVLRESRCSILAVKPEGPGAEPAVPAVVT